MNEAKREAIKSHGKDDYLLSEKALELREQKHTGIELNGVELAYLRELIFQRIGTVGNKISALGKAPNPRAVEDELSELKQELKFLQNDFAEKLFEKD